MRHLLMLVLALLPLAACGGADSLPAPVEPPAVSVVELRFSLARRAIPAGVTQLRFTGFDGNELLSFGDVTHPKAEVIRLRDVPSSVAFLTIEYLAGERAQGRGSVSVQLSPDQTTIVEDPPFQDVQPQALGVNFNGLLATIDLSDLERTRTRWIRCFVDYFEWQQNPSSFESGFQKLRQAHQAGYLVIVNLKFNFEGKLFPMGPLETEQLLQDVPALLDKVYSNCDILVIGNEPFIESQKGVQRGEPLIAFYQAAALKVKAYWDRQQHQVPLYLGAYDSIWKSEPWQQQAEPLLEFTRKQRWLQGADLHLHQTENVDIDEAFRFVQPRLRKDQSILITEFSQVNYYLEFNQDFIPASLILQYGRPDDWFVYNYLNYALGNPVSLQEWTTFLKDSPWFESKKDYLNVAWGKFQAHPQVAVATYGMYQSCPPQFTKSDQPWILNPLFANQTVVLDPDPQPNYPFFEQFLAIQAALDARASSIK